MKRPLAYIFYFLPIYVLAQHPTFLKIDSLNKKAEEHYYYQKDSTYYFYGKITEIAKKIDNDSVLVESLFNIAGAASYHFDLKKMGASLSQLDTLIPKEFTKINDNLHILLYYKGDYQLKLFEYSKSKESFERILSNGKGIPNAQKSQIQSSLESAAYSFLGKIYMLEGRYDEAKMLYEKNIRDLFYLQPDNLEALNGNYNLLAEVLMKEKKYAEANAYLLKAFAYNKEQNNTNSLITNTFHIAENYGHRLEKDSALYFLSESRKYFKGKPVFYPKYHLRKAEIHKNNWEYEVALAEIDSAIQLIDQNFKGQKSADVETAYNEKGKLYVLLNQEQKAIVSFDLALKKALENSDRNLFALKIYKNKLASLNRLNSQDAYQKTVVAALDAIALLDKLKPGFKSAADKLVLIEDAFPIFESAIEASYKLFIATNNKDYLKKAFLFSEKSKSVLLLEALLSSKATKFANIPEQIVERESQLKSEISFIEKQLQTNNNDEIELKNDLFKLKQDKRELIITLENEYPAYFDLKYTTKVLPLDELQAQLAIDERMFSYFYGNNFIYILGASTTDANFYRIEINQTLEDEIVKLHSLLSNPKSNVKLLSELSFSLYQKLMPPILEDSTKKRIIIAPDGLLNYIPFGSFVTNLEQNRYLIQDRSIGYVNSASLWSQLKYRNQINNKLLAFAPNFNATIASDATRSGVLGNLPHNRKEVEQITKSFKGLSFLDEKATLQNFTSSIFDYSIIHLATHAVVDDKNPEYSYLAFKPSLESEDLLMIKDIYNLSINASLVTLSACESAIGDLKRGEGFLSLARGFFYSGAASIASTLWKVNDRSSADLMGSFYENMANGASKDQALRSAKRSFLNKNRDNGLSHPYYWSGYIVQGNTQALSTATRWWWYGLGASFLILLFLFRKSLFKLFK